MALFTIYNNNFDIDIQTSSNIKHLGGNLYEVNRLGGDIYLKSKPISDVHTPSIYSDFIREGLCLTYNRPFNNICIIDNKLVLVPLLFVNSVTIFYKTGSTKKILVGRQRELILGDNNGSIDHIEYQSTLDRNSYCLYPPPAYVKPCNLNLIDIKCIRSNERIGTEYIVSFDLGIPLPAYIIYGRNTTYPIFTNSANISPYDGVKFITVYTQCGKITLPLPKCDIDGGQQ